MTIDFNDQYYLGDAAMLGEFVGPQKFLNKQEGQTIRDWGLTNNVSVWQTYLDRTYLDVYGQERSAAELFLQVANGQVTEMSMLDTLMMRTDADGNRISGADWFDEFAEKFINQMNASRGILGDGGPTKAQRIASAVATISDRAKQMGLNYSNEDIVGIATLAINDNWQDVQVIDKLLENYNYGEVSDGTITDLADQTIATYNQFMLDIDRKTATQIAGRIAKGEATVDGVISSVKRLARTQHAWAESYIDDGLTVLEAIGPQRTALATELELDPQEIDLNNQTMFDSLFTIGTDGTRRLGSSAEVRRAARQMPQWADTSSAKQSMSQLTQTLGKIFGRGGMSYG